MNRNSILNREFELFFTGNYPKVKSFALRILMSEQDAEDVAQDMFMKLLTLPEIWQDEEVADKYLFTMTRNHIFNLIKRKGIERKYQEELIVRGKLIEEFGLEKELYAKELELMAIHTIEQMPEQRKRIFKMSRYEGKSNAEISESTSLSVRTVERHIYLALAELKKKLLLLVF